MAIPQVSAQSTLWLETFEGGESTTGFTVGTNTSDCHWVYAPDSVHPGFTFSMDFAGVWPAGPGFDSSFVFLDSDECAASGAIINSLLTSAPFDASGPGSYVLNFSHQFRARLQSFIHIDAWDGANWNEVYHHTATDVGYPNLAVIQSVDITTGTAGSMEALVRFQFSAGWDWWWALDRINVVNDPTVGIHEEHLPTLGLYPNPATDVIQIDRMTNGMVTVRVFDPMGALVMQRSMARTLDVSSLADGIYLLEALDAAGKPLARTRFVKE
jgi:hypothetical protein